MDTILFDQDNIKVYYNQDADCVVWQPIGSQQSKDKFIESFTSGVNFLLANYRDSMNWINDTSEYDGCRGELTDWIVDNVNPHLKTWKRPLKICFIQPKSKRGIASIHIYIAETDLDPNSNIQCKLVDNMDDALAWIKE